MNRIDPPQRSLLGPGPSDVAPSVLRALAAPTLGHLDPRTLDMMRELAEMLRAIFETKNPCTLAVSGTGTSGMETALVNLIEPGDRVLVAVHGYFGARLAEIAQRVGGDVTVVEQEWGQPSDPAKLRAAAAGRKFKVLAAVHAETSTGVKQELAPLSAVAEELGALFVVDAVTSLGCTPVGVDRARIDVVYSCSQKGLSCTSGLSPVSFSPRAMEAIARRKQRVASFYLDIALLERYWHGDHLYHHTACSNLFAALHEATRLVLEEGLEARFARHARLSKALVAGLEGLGLELLVPAHQRLPQLLAVKIPDGVDDLAVRKALLAQYSIEIGGGLGALKGKIWRIGLMGSGATPRNVLLAVSALASVLGSHGFRPRSEALAAAGAALAS
ncbi:MAG: alanine--glyoxylate aminotransferase family protein [Planctomycetes bacterium]|nr:alanine--glyoxylate aminotransferase family protein [Planctomycetota bacterium]